MLLVTVDTVEVNRVHRIGTRDYVAAVAEASYIETPLELAWPAVVEGQ